MDWRQFVMDLEALNPDTVEEVFARHGAHAVTFMDAGGQPVFEPLRGETPLWQQARVVALFADETDIASLTRDLSDTLRLERLPAHHVEYLEDRDWDREWRNELRPMRFGNRLWICPGDTRPATRRAVIVKLDPGLAFGTGHHATTALCLEWLDAQSLTDLGLLDYGCGSGLLAIAALRLGCASACALDIDPQALQATRSNAARNDVAARLTVCDDATEIRGRFDIVVANILAEPLVRDADRIVGYVRRGGTLLLSGILSRQVDEVASAYAEWIAFDDPVFRVQDGLTWALLIGRGLKS